MRRKKITIIKAAVLCILDLCLMMTGISTIPVPAKTQTSMSKQKFKPVKQIKKKERDRYYSKSAFVGNSISKGLKLYFDSRGKGICGHPTMLVQGSYSFINDKKQGSPYQIVYRGKRMKAKEAIAAAKVKRVFINMGTNDLWKPSAQTYRDYVDYIRGIQRRNPKVVIFIQGTTPMCSARNKRYLNNSAIQSLNKRMKKYCKGHKDLYYVDVSRGLKTAEGGLQRKYASDGYVHMTMEGYRIWAKNLNSYVSRLMLQEKNAEKAVDWAAQNKTKGAYGTARKWVNHLEKSTLKQKLQRKLKRIKKKIEESEQNPNDENGASGENTAPEGSPAPEESPAPEGSLAPEGSPAPEGSAAPEERVAAREILQASYYLENIMK